MKKFISLMLFVTMFMHTCLCAKDFIVKNKNELDEIITLLSPGDKVILKEGNWENISLIINKNGTLTKPIIFKAETPGKVKLTGNSSVSFNASYNMLEGIILTNGFLNNGNSVITFNAHNCKLKDCVISYYNPDSCRKFYNWVRLYGSYNEITNCLFEGKNHLGSIIKNEDGAKFTRIEGCCFKDIPYIKDMNVREVIQVFGYGRNGENGTDGAYSVIANNLFYKADGEGMEIISLKSNNNIVKGNTVIETRGGIVSRAGNSNIIVENIIIGNDKSETCGIRIAGMNHVVMNNYIEGVSDYGISLVTGEYIKDNISGGYYPFNKGKGPGIPIAMYQPVKHCRISENVIKNCRGNNYEIGYFYKLKWPERQLIILPDSNMLYLTKEDKGKVNIVKHSESKISDLFKESTNILRYKNESVEQSVHPLSESLTGPIWMR